MPKGYASKKDYIETLKCNLRLLKQPDYLPNNSKEWKQVMIKHYQEQLAKHT